MSTEGRAITDASTASDSGLSIGGPDRRMNPERSQGGLDREPTFPRLASSRSAFPDRSSGHRGFGASRSSHPVSALASRSANTRRGPRTPPSSRRAGQISDATSRACLQSRPSATDERDARPHKSRTTRGDRGIGPPVPTAPRAIERLVSPLGCAPPSSRRILSLSRPESERSASSSSGTPGSARRIRCACC